MGRNLAGRACDLHQADLAFSLQTSSSCKACTGTLRINPQVHSETISGSIFGGGSDERKTAILALHAGHVYPTTTTSAATVFPSWRVGLVGNYDGGNHISKRHVATFA
jgi:hypothetical protein